MTVFITQLIYIKPGAEKVFDEFEALAIPIISRYRGRLLLRLRPDSAAYIEGNAEKPYEIHLVEFENENWFQQFMADETRKKFLHLKEASVQLSVLYKGVKL
ncbi:MAG: DUF1330 domain-containing protein [Bacteroidetes bacterium]|nr:DUF1330 domain-containing protein [Bacteroidota bacterium]